MLVYEITDLREESIPGAPDFQVEPRRPANNGRVRGYNLVGPDGTTERFATKRAAIEASIKRQRDLDLIKNLRSAAGGIPEPGKVGDPIPTGKDKKVRWLETDANGRTTTRTGTVDDYADELNRRDPGKGDDYLRKLNNVKSGWLRRIGTILKKSPLFIIGSSIMGIAIWQDFQEEIAIIEATLDAELNENLSEAIKRQAKKNAIQDAWAAFYTMQVVNVIGQLAIAAAAPRMARSMQRWLRPAVTGARWSPSSKWNPWVIGAWVVGEVGLWGVEAWIKSDDTKFVQGLVKVSYEMMASTLGWTWDMGVAAIDNVEFDMQDAEAAIEQAREQGSGDNDPQTGTVNPDTSQSRVDQLKGVFD